MGEGGGICWVSGGRWIFVMGGWRCVDIFMDGWGWKGVSGGIFWVGGGEWGWSLVLV